jgi:hypothetical protein
VQSSGIENGLAEYQGFARFDFKTVGFDSPYAPPVNSINVKW